MSKPSFIEYYTHSSGRLFAVGDIHGCYDLLMQKLEQAHFDFQTDVLIAVGDIVDRGPDSLKCVNLIDERWFKVILGNHEEMCLLSRNETVMAEMHARHGGEWFYQLDLDQQQNVIEKLSNLPVVLEVHHQNKKYGFVHADIPLNDWNAFKIALGSKGREAALWGRGRIQHRGFMRYRTVKGIDQVFLGHTVVDAVTQRDNCYYLDTGAYLNGELSVVEIKQNSLKIQ